jgi:hypothetical protein
MLGAVIGAIRIRGRWVSLELLDRLSQRSQGPAPPSRQELVEQFCRTTDWRDAKGRLSVSSASAALRRLETLGKVQLPPMAHRAKAALSRGLSDDGQPLPELPKLLARSSRTTGLRLRLVQDEHDPAHRIWNRLIVREHPLGRSPLVGAQLRYLIECDQGLLAQQQNRGKVLGLSRFVLRPGLRVPNLASQCYGLVLGQVARDWQERYGVKPVLVETYVERVRHNELSLAASNWRRIGGSKGRGRDDPRRQKSQTPKDVWVYELEPDARAQLQAQQVEVLAPRSVFAPALAEDWVEEEMAEVDLGDERLNRRARDMLANRWARPGSSFYRSFDSPAQAKGAYQLVENPRGEIHLASLLPLGTAYAEVWARPQQSDTAALVCAQVGDRGLAWRAQISLWGRRSPDEERPSAGESFGVGHDRGLACAAIESLG